MNNRKKISYKDIDRFIKINSEIQSKENKEILIKILCAFLDNMNMYGIEDDFENFGVVREQKERDKIINFLSDIL